MKTTKILTALLLPLLLVLALAACGSRKRTDDNMATERQRGQRDHDRRAKEPPRRRLALHKELMDAGELRSCRRTLRFGKRFSWRPTRA